MIKFKDFCVKLWIYFSFFILITVVGYIFYFLISKGISHIDLTFLTENPKGLPLGVEGGIYQSLVGSFFLMLLSMLFSGILGLSCAVYNVVFNKSKLINLLITLSVQCVSSIPSIIIGLFVYGFFIVTLKIPQSLLAASIALSIMVFPFVEIQTEKAINDIDKQFIKDSYSLGIDKTYMCINLILPLIKKNTVSTLLLAGSYAMGATAPLLLTGVVFITKSTSLLKPVMALPFHLHMLLSQSVATEKAYATALVLIFILLIIHILSELIIRNVGGKLIEYITDKKS